MVEIGAERIRHNFVEAMILGFADERLRPALRFGEVGAGKDAGNAVAERNYFLRLHCGDTLRPAKRLQLWLGCFDLQDSAANMQIALRVRDLDAGLAQFLLNGEIQVALESA